MKEDEHLEIVSEYLTFLDGLNIIEQKWGTAQQRKEELETRLLDISHCIEEHLDLKTLSGEECKNLLQLIQDYLKIRRNYKKEEILYDTMENNKAKLGYTNQRTMLIAEICKKEKSVQTHYNPRILQYDDIEDMIRVKRKRGRKPKDATE